MWVEGDKVLSTSPVTVYARFEQNTTGVVTPAPIAPDTPISSVTASEVRSIFLGVNSRKVMSLDGVLVRALGSCVDQLAEVFTDILNLSLLQTEILTCFKKTTIIPVLKKTHAVCL
eukprot:g16433.t1